MAAKDQRNDAGRSSAAAFESPAADAVVSLPRALNVARVVKGLAVVFHVVELIIWIASPTYPRVTRVVRCDFCRGDCDPYLWRGSVSVASFLCRCCWR